MLLYSAGKDLAWWRMKIEVCGKNDSFTGFDGSFWIDETPITTILYYITTTFIIYELHSPLFTFSCYNHLWMNTSLLIVEYNISSFHC